MARQRNSDHAESNSRYYMTRKQMYERALAMQKRIEELRVVHKWGPKELSFVELALDETMPIQLHNIGKSSLMPNSFNVSLNHCI